MFSLLVLLACTPTPTTPPGHTNADGTTTVGAAPDPSRLDVAVNAHGPQGGIPTEITFNFSLPIFPKPGADPTPPDGTVVTFEPELAGRLVVVDRSTLRFEPASPLPPEMTWKVTVQAIGGTDGAWRANWQPAHGEIVAPAFTFLHPALKKWDRQRSEAEINLVFAGPVDADTITQRLSLSLDGAPLLPHVVTAGGSPEVVRILLADRRLAGVPGPDRALTVKLAAGVPLLGMEGVVAPAGEGTIALVSDAPPVSVKTVKLREGQDGFYVDVVCDDGAVDQKRYYWDRDDYNDYRVSVRCQLDESAASSVHLTPDVPFTLGPADGGFRIFTSLPFGEAHLRIDAGARTVDGGALTETVEQALDVPHRKASVSFTSRGRYLPRDAWNNLEIHATNVPMVELVVRHVPTENLPFWMSGSEAADERTSDIVLRKRIPLRAPLDQEATSYLDVASLVPDAKSGLYDLHLTQVDPDEKKAETPVSTNDTASGDEEGYVYRTYAEAASRILITNLHLIAKVGGPPRNTAGSPWTSQIRVWAADVHTNDPSSGVDLALIRPSGKTVARCTTGADGACTLQVPADPYDDTTPIAIIARKDDDVTYLAFKDLKVDVTADVSGQPWTTEAPWRGAVWTDRGVYRPGDNVHVAALLRGIDHAAPTENVPTLVKLYDPRDKELRRIVATTNEAGLLAVDFPVSEHASTGRYRVVVDIGGVEAGSSVVNVEEFVPERLRVVAKPAQAAWRAGDPMDIAVEASWLFGGAAQNARTELTCELTRGTFPIADHPGYRVGPALLDDDAPDAPLAKLGTVQGQLDADGKGTLRCPTPGSTSSLWGPATLTARAAVFEGDTGRSTVQTVTAPVHPDTAYVALQGNLKEGEAGRPIPVDGLVVDWKGKPVTGTRTVDVELVELHEEMGWLYDSMADEARYRRLLRRNKVQSLQVQAVNGVFHTSFTPKTGGAGWLVVARLGHSQTEIHVEAKEHRWWWSSLDADVDQTPLPRRPTDLPIHVPELARVGDRVDVTATAPYAGRILWTVETDQVVRSAWQTANPGENHWTVPIDTFEPNVYVSALLIKDPHLESPQAFIPDRAYGVASLRIEPTAFTQSLKVNVPKEVRPGDTLSVRLDAGPLTEPSYVTVAAVDAGILSLTHFPDPDPAETIFARRSLGVISYETIGWTLLHAPGGAGLHTGGDAAGGLGRVQMVKPVALWSGIVPVGRDGTAKVDFVVPRYRGTLHVMAVVAGAKRMGHAAADVLVREPLTLTSTLPRFLLTGDRAQVPVQVTNLSGAAQSVTVQMRVDDGKDAEENAYVDIAGGGAAVGFDGAQIGKLQLAKDQTGTVVFQLAARATGAAVVHIDANAGTLHSEDLYTVPVMSPDPEVRRVNRVTLAKGDTDLSGPFSGWQRGTDRSTVWVTRNPYGQAMARMKHLLRYPYGCIEQTTSTTRPLLYAHNLLQDVAPEVLAKNSVNDMVTAGIDRVLGMQTPVGGFGYWPGDSHPTLWGTAYATHMLVDARTAGFTVSDRSVNDALSWMERQLDRTYGTEASDLAYTHYVLAVAGRPHAAQAQRLLDAIAAGKADGTHEEDVYLLKAAIQKSGDRRYENELSHPKRTEITLTRENRWSYWSDLRDEALRLSVYRDLFGLGGGGDALADVVAGALSSDRDAWYYTTQELAWAVTGLGKSLPDTLAAITTPELFAGPRALTPADRKGKASPDWTWSLSNAAGGPPVRVHVPDSGAGTLYAVVSTEGVRTAGDVPYGGDGLTLSRTWLDASGKPLDIDHVTLGTAFYVRLTLENRTGHSIPNVALNDRLPAGWEIENPRLGRGGLPEGVDADELWDVEHFDIRDDRYTAFGTVPAGSKVQVVYMVRAVTAGQWSMPEASATAMYDPTVWARVAHGPVSVVGMWAGFLL